MPQLDSTTFFSQFFWLSFFFVGFYGLLVKYYLPRMSRILKLRQRKVSSGQTDQGSLHQENAVLHSEFDHLFLEGIQTSSSIHQLKTKQTKDWISTVLASTNQTQFHSVNTNYLQTIGDQSVQQKVLSYHCRSVCAPSSFQLSGIQTQNHGSAKEKMYSFRVFEHLFN